jgi:hypothetical protein
MCHPPFDCCWPKTRPVADYPIPSRRTLRERGSQGEAARPKRWVTRTRRPAPLNGAATIVRLARGPHRATDVTKSCEEAVVARNPSIVFRQSQWDSFLEPRPRQLTD